MKKTNKLFVVIMAAVMAIPMVACESNVEVTPTPAATTTEVTEAQPTEESVVEPEVTEVPETTEEVTEVTEAPEPTEEPVVSDDPNVIDGYDFTDFNEKNSDANYDKVVDSMEYDTIKFIIHHYEETRQVIGILSNGDKYYVPVDDADNYCFYFYFPKEVLTVEADGMDTYNETTQTYLYIQGGKNGYSANIRDTSIITEDGYELTGHVVYTDGTEETIVITLYPEQ